MPKGIVKSDSKIARMVRGIIENTFRNTSGSIDVRMSAVRTQILHEGFSIHTLAHTKCSDGVHITFDVTHADGVRRACQGGDGMLIRNKRSLKEARESQARNRAPHLRLAQSLRDRKRSVPTPVGWE